MKNKFYIVTDIETHDLDQDHEEILNCLGIWTSEGRTEDERINNLWEKVQDYMGVYLTSLEYCNNRPHTLTSFN